jgi:hypothetical protein
MGKEDTTLYFRIVFWDVLPCKVIVDRQYIPEDNSEIHTRRRENLKSHTTLYYYKVQLFKIVLRKHSQFTLAIILKPEIQNAVIEY